MYNLWGHWSVGYHAVNIFLHACFAILIFRILNLMAFKGALVAALMFALHPVAVESVSWVSELKNVLSGTLLAASLLWLCFYLKLFTRPSSLSPRLVYAISFILFLGALASKTVTCVMPVFAIALLYWQRGCISKGQALAIAPFFLAGFVAGLLTIWVEKEFLIEEVYYFTTLDMPARLIIAGKAVWFYLSKLVWPTNLAFIYPKFNRQVTPEAFLPLAAVGLMFILLYLLRKKIGRGPICAWTCYVAALFPALGFFDVYPFVYSYVADHFQYLAMPSFFIFFGGFWAQARQGAGKAASKALTIALSLVLLFLALQTIQTQVPYQNSRTLWESVIIKNPDSVIANNNLATILYDNGEYSRAIYHWKVAMQADPPHIIPYTNLGLRLMDLGRHEEARDIFKRAILLKPNDFETARGIALAYMGLAELGEPTWDLAVDYMTKALNFRPLSAPANHNLGVILGRAGRYEEARKYMEKARILNPREVGTLVDLYGVLIRLEDFEAADDLLAALEQKDHSLALRAQTLYGPKDN